MEAPRIVEAGDGASRGVEDAATSTATALPHAADQTAALAGLAPRAREVEGHMSPTAALVLWLGAVLVFLIVVNLFYRRRRYKPMPRLRSD